jgi:hypothetical protein
VIGAAVVTIAAAGGLAFAVAGDAGPAAPVAPHFIDDTAAAGIDQRYDGDFEFFVGGGVAAFDCDDDERPDLYIAGGTEPAGLYRNESDVGGALRFTRLESAVTDLTEVTGAYPIDIDGDAHLDLVVTVYGRTAASVFYGDGDGGFGDEHGVGSGGHRVGDVVTGDLDGDGTPDVVLGVVDADDKTFVSVLLNTLGRRHH